MKRFLICIAVLITSLLVSCDKEDSTILDDPDTRLNALLTEYQSVLDSAPNGWVATIYPVGGKGYSFYFKFGTNGRVTMMSDFNSTTSETPAESTYRLKALQRPTLIFDTYSYIHLLADPTASVNGGATGYGLESDFQFGFIELKGDSIRFEGTFNKNAMVMVKATADEEQKYTGAAVKQLMTATTQFLSDNRNPYLQFSDEVKLSLTITPASKLVSLSYVDDNDQSHSVSSAFAFKVDRIVLQQPLIYNGNSFTELLWDASLKTYYVIIGSNRINVLNSPTPIIPLRVLLGAGKDYSQIEYAPASVPANLSAPFNAIYSAAKTGLAGLAGRVLGNVRVLFNIDNTMSLRFYYVNTAGTAFQANMTYRMSKAANGDLSFVYLSSDNNATVVGSGLVALKDYFSNNTFRPDWVINPNSAASLGGLYVTTNASSFFYGTLIK